MRKQYFADDRPIKIPEDIMNMSNEELEREITRLEKEAALEKQRILEERLKKAV